jgi:hypothetical protein
VLERETHLLLRGSVGRESLASQSGALDTYLQHAGLAPHLTAFVEHHVLPRAQHMSADNLHGAVSHEAPPFGVSPRDFRLDCDMVARVITYIHCTGPPGAVLVFLPGWDAVRDTSEALAERLGRLPSPIDLRARILPLHGLLSSADQRAVFAPVAPGERKIVLSTNIAETSITIDDIVYVVDTGLAKEQGYDTSRDMDVLQLCAISRASAHQRRGRAGRVQPGVCIRLYSRFQFVHGMPPSPLPELLAIGLEETVLRIKGLHIAGTRPVASVLSDCLSAPDPQAVERAVRSLTGMGALRSESEELTTLGRHLARLPLPPRLGKLVLIGALLQCVDAVVTIAAILAHRDPFVMVVGKEAQVDAVRRRFAGESQSDHLASWRAYREWKACRSDSERREYCWANFLSPPTLRMIDGMREQFVEYLRESGFLGRGSGAWAAANAHTGEDAIVLTALCAGLYPRVAQLRVRARTCQVQLRGGGPRVGLHPKCALARGGDYERVSPFAVYHVIMESTQLFLHDVSPVPPLALVFFGGCLRVQHGLSAAETASAATVDATMDSRSSDPASSSGHVGAAGEQTTGCAPAVAASWEELAESGSDEELSTDPGKAGAAAQSPVLSTGGSSTDVVLQVDEWISYRCSAAMAELAMAVRCELERVLLAKLHDEGSADDGRASERLVQTVVRVVSMDAYARASAQRRRQRW